MHLPNVDLNLFQVFDAVYTERNLTRAARILNVTQPAVSNALKRLRQVFNDPLFIRVPHGVTPTPIADTISDWVKEALHLLNTSLTEGQSFDPESSEKSFSLSLHEMEEAMLVPRLMQRLAECAPGISVSCYTVPRKDLENELASGNLDFALDVPLFSVPRLHRRQISTERYVCMIRPGHPLAGQPLTLVKYLALEHIHVSARRGGVGHVDMALERLGRQRKIQLHMKSYMAAPEVVSSTNLALTVPLALAGLYDLETLELPFSVDTLDQYLYWHRNADQDRSSRWMRELLLGLLGEENGP